MRVVRCVRREGEDLLCSVALTRNVKKEEKTKLPLFLLSLSPPSLPPLLVSSLSSSSPCLLPLFLLSLSPPSLPPLLVSSLSSSPPCLLPHTEQLMFRPSSAGKGGEKKEHFPFLPLFSLSSLVPRPSHVCRLQYEIRSKGLVHFIM